MKREQLTELLYQALETEQGGTQVYETALRCVQNDKLQEEWEKYLEQTRTHVQIMLGLFEAFGLDPETITPGPRRRATYRPITRQSHGNGTPSRAAGGCRARGVRVRRGGRDEGSSQLGVEGGCERGAQGR